MALSVFFRVLTQYSRYRVAHDTWGGGGAHHTPTGFKTTPSLHAYLLRVSTTLNQGRNKSLWFQVLIHLDPGLHSTLWAVLHQYGRELVEESGEALESSGTLLQDTITMVTTPCSTPTCDTPLQEPVGPQKPSQ